MPARRVSRAGWERAPGWNGGWHGETAGTGVSFIFTEVSGDGQGPRLHSHAYDEVQIVRRGSVYFMVDGERLDAEEGDIVVIPAGCAHLVRTVGDGMAEVMSVHLNPRLEATWLE